MENTDEAFIEAFPVMMAVAFGMAHRILGHNATADDVAAEALARAYARWGQIGTAEHRDAWIARVTANIACSWLRRRQHSPPSPHTQTLDDRVTAQVLVRDALSHLSRRQREVVALCLLAEFTETEAARAMRVSVGTVKRHLHRGRQALRARLDPDAWEAAHAQP